MASSNKPKRILLAGLFHETNTFAPGHIELAEFSVCLGTDIFKLRGNGSPLGAFLEEAESFGWEVIPTIDCRAMPGSLPSPEVFDFFYREFESRTTPAATGDLDAIFLVLHGAMATTGYLDIEGELLTRIRQQAHLAHLPIFGVLDLHANTSRTMADHSQGLLVYRENPHTDGAETARRAARLLKKTFDESLSLKTEFVPTSVIWPPPGTATAGNPMRYLEDRARHWEANGIEAVNVFAGFAHADTPHTRVSFSIVYNQRQISAERLAEVSQDLQEAVETRKTEGFPKEWDLEAAIDDALSKGLYPACLVEPADNIGGGAAGDGTSILRMLLRKHVTGAGVIINDAEAVATLRHKPAGSIQELEIGGRGFPSDPGPVLIKAKLLRITDGTFTLEDPHSHLAAQAGMHIEMGPCAVLDCEGIFILLTSRRTPPFDLGQWRSQGVDPEKLSLIGIKAAVAHRQAYDPITKASYTVQTPGPCSSDLLSLSYKHLHRPIFPLDP